MKVDIVFYIPAEIWESFYEKSGSWGMVQNAPGQSDCRIFKSSAFAEQNDEIVWIFRVDTHHMIQIKLIKK